MGRVLALSDFVGAGLAPPDSVGAALAPPIGATPTSPFFGLFFIKVQYRTSRYRGVSPGKIALACRAGITQDAEFKRFNIWPEPMRFRPYYLPQGDRATTMLQ